MTDDDGAPTLPVHVLNVTYPLVDDELIAFAAGKDALLIVEEGQPEFLEQAIGLILHRANSSTRVHGKDVLPMAGEYTGLVMRQGVAAFLKATMGRTPVPLPAPPALTLADVPARPSGFCTGCPERPIFTALKLLQRELGPIHISCDIGCHLFSVLPPFSVGNTTMGYGLGWAGAAALNTRAVAKRTISIMGDGGFWHNGLTSGVGNAVFNRSDNILVIVDNGYSAATGGQDLPSSRGKTAGRTVNNPIERAVRGVGVDWVRRIDTYKLAEMKRVLHEAMTTDFDGPKVIVAQGECMLNRQRRERPILSAAVAGGQRVVRSRFGVDAALCTGDHSCIRLSGCPSLTVKPNPDPLREDPIAAVEQSCVGCGVCGEIAHAAVLCPSFWRADVVANPGRVERIMGRVRNGVITALQSFAEQRRQARTGA